MARVGLGGTRGSQETPLFCSGEGLQGRLSRGTRGRGLDGDLSRRVIGTGVGGRKGDGTEKRTEAFGPFLFGDGKPQGFWEQ